MSSTLDKILHHQRIIVTGHRAAEIIGACRKVLDHYQRPYDVATTVETRLGDGPIVFIESSEMVTNYHPHIALIDQIPQEMKNEYMKLADSLPKSGTLVYNKADKVANEISSIQRTDVYLEPFQGSQAHEAAMVLLKRIGINEASFKAVIK